MRARDEAASIASTLASLRRQTVVPEIILVDSGSTDGTREIASPLCDQILRLAPSEFSYGRALNRGAAVAAAPIHFALSAHCVPATDTWIEESLAHYGDARVAGTGGGLCGPDGRPLTCTMLQRADDVRAHPTWGFSNHASSWRACVWREFPFNENLPGTEDKEWAWRVLGAGWCIAFDPRLTVDMSHQWTGGVRDRYRRELREARGLASFAPMGAYGLRDLLHDWWSDTPTPARRPPWMHRCLNMSRAAGLAGRYRGRRS